MIHIYDKSFHTKAELRKYTKKLIYDNLGMLIKPNDTYWGFFTELFKRHPERDFYGKIEEIELLTNEGNYFKVCLYCKGKGVHTISIERCVSGLPMTEGEKYRRVMRELIQPEIDNYKLDNTERCANCNSDKNLQTDHEVPFSALRNSFISIHGLAKGDFIWINNRLINTDYIFNNAWKKFHMDNATFQTLCKSCNIKKSNK